MNLKDKVIRKLLDMGKKHRILVYPTLAIVAIITAFSHAVYWGRGNGRKLVASVMIMALLITQSLFLTSSADTTAPASGDIASGTDAGGAGKQDALDYMNLDSGNPEDMEGTVLFSDGAVPASVDNIIVRFNLVNSDNGVFNTMQAVHPTEILGDELVISYPGMAEIADALFSGTAQNQENYFEFDFYTDGGCSSEIAYGSNIPYDSAVYQYNIYIKPTRTAYPVVIQDEKNLLPNENKQINVTGSAAGDIYPAVTFTVGTEPLSNLNRRGYTFAGYEYAGTTYTDGADISINPDSAEYILFTSKWTPMTFKVNYDAAGADAPEAIRNAETELGDEVAFESDEITYGDSISLPGTALIQDKGLYNEAWYISGWRNETTGEVYDVSQPVDSSKLAADLNNVEDEPNIQGVTLTAVWAYRNIELGINTEGTDSGVAVNNNGTGIVIDGSYGDRVECIIRADYSDSMAKGDEFTYTVSDFDVFKSLGLDVVAHSGANKQLTISGQLNNITSAPATITLEITDINNPDTVSTYTISLNSARRKVTLDAGKITDGITSDKPSKKYDGKREINVCDKAPVLNAVAGDGIDDVAVSFSSHAMLTNANAGDNKDITLSSVQLTGNKADMYELAGEGYDASAKTYIVEKIAKVERRTVRIEIELLGDSDKVLFGQDSPVYKVKLADPMELAEIDRDRYNGSNDASIAGFMRDYIGHTGWQTERAIYSAARGEAYVMYPTFSFENKNYNVEASNGADFYVERDAGDSYFAFSKEKQPNGYYPAGTELLPTGIYDHIRVIEDGSDITADMSRTEAQNLFSSSYKFTESCTNKTFVVQMMDYDTGAITYPVSINVNVDLDPPEFVSFRVSPNINKYFNNLSFGSYYRPDNGDSGRIDSASLTVLYESPDSACANLFYYFADESGNVKDGSVGLGKVAMVRNADGKYQAEFSIGTAASGQLVVYAEDTTGNQSVRTLLRTRKLDDDASEEFGEGFDNSSYYEWMFENRIDAAAINVSNNAAVGGWYNALDFTVDASDTDSGVNKIVWTISDAEGNTYEQEQTAGSKIASIRNITSYGKILEYVFDCSIPMTEGDIGEYTVGAVMYDNAGNSVSLTSVGPYKIDSKAPVVDYEIPILSGYHESATFEFTVTEGENESGVSEVKLYKESIGDENLINTWGDDGIYEQEIYENGDYVLVASDRAGNVTIIDKITFSGISSILPGEPMITVESDDAKLGNDGWYIGDKPSVTVTTADNITAGKLEDGTPAYTFYRITVNGTVMNTVPVTGESYTFKLEHEGTILIEAWSESASNIKSAVVTETIKVDVTAPEITITGATPDNKGNVVVSFKVTDSISGVNADKVTVNGAKVDVTSENGIIRGSFVTDNSDKYSIVVEDNAGNVSEPVEYKPLRIQASPVINVTRTGAYLKADVYEGTNPITECTVRYKKVIDEAYDDCLFNSNKTDYGLSLEHNFINLTPDTEYEYIIYASTDIEEAIVTGRFRTLDSASKAKLYGSVAYSDSLADSFKTYPIFVNLYNGNTVIAGVEIADADNMIYSFDNIPDGNYRIVATNGLLSRETKVIVTNGGIEYPLDYASNGGINFVLSGLSTRVEIEDNEVFVTADGLDKIFNTALYNGNVTEDDLEVVRNGGTIDIVLHAGYIKVSDVSDTVQSILSDKIGSGAVIERYIQLYIVKEVRDASGRYVNNTPSNITRLKEPVSVSFPLGELSGQKIYVASLHGSDSNYAFINWNDGSNITISDTFVTIQTDRFSVYALYRMPEVKKTYTVKWVDGDGRVMKTEIVEEGKSATPPASVPTKKETDKYTYKFSGWNKEYSSITEDTVIAAWFTAIKKDNGNNDNNPPSGNNGSNNGASGDKDGSKDEIGVTDKNYTYMGSAESPTTGDASPIVLVVVMMTIAASGIVLMRKKLKKM